MLPFPECGSTSFPVCRQRQLNFIQKMEFQPLTTFDVVLALMPDFGLSLIPMLELQSASSPARSGAATAGCSSAAAASDAGPAASAVLFSAGRSAPAPHSPFERAGL